MVALLFSRKNDENDVKKNIKAGKYELAVREYIGAKKETHSWIFVSDVVFTMLINSNLIYDKEQKAFFFSGNANDALSSIKGILNETITTTHQL